MVGFQLSTSGITKRFGSVLANDNISLTFRRGEVYAIIGENGAGKTTFFNMLYGVYEPDQGEIRLDGNRLAFRSPRDAIKNGIYLVQQNFALIDNFTVAENFALLSGWQLKPLNLNSARKSVEAIAEKSGLKVKSNATVEELPLSLRQRAEILKGLSLNAQVLLLDEPTAVLGPPEVKELTRIIKALAAEGKTVIFTSHKLAQVEEISDYIYILRRGKLVAEFKTSEVDDIWSLAKYMVGEEFVKCLPERRVTDSSALLSVRNLKVQDKQHRIVVKNVTFDLQKGEIIGIAGVAGNGQKELAEAIVGLTSPTEGEIVYEGRNTKGISAKSLRHEGIGYMPEDGGISAIVPDFTIEENLCLTTFDSLGGNSFLLDKKCMEDSADALIRAFDIKPPIKDLLVKHLSGGNMQKTIAARELSRSLKLLISYNPTKGLDIKATTVIRSKILEKRNEGTAVILISEDLEEIMELSDKIAVIFEGQIKGIKKCSQTNLEEIGEIMSGREF
ncbi:MAG: ABC transporter ATP-binding protein [Candidatus Bathyarchaeia archaeon]|jgi:simple sugar transport system ATP-binding protein